MGKMSKIIITGINGFVGYYLAKKFLSEKWEVIGIDLHSEPKYKDLKIKYKQVDILNSEKIFHIIEEVNPDKICHLAGITFVPTSIENPMLTIDVNIKGFLNILNAVKEVSQNTKILFVSSAEVYGNKMNKGCFSEEDKLNPQNPYAITKATSEYFCRFYKEKYNLNIVIARPFNHIGPGQSPVFVISDFAKQIAMIENNLKPPIIKVGNLKNKKPFLNVKDVVNAYYLLLTKDTSHFIYNISNSHSYSIEELLNILISFSKKQISVQVDPSKYRKITYDVKGCIDKITSELNWQIKYDIKSTLLEILNWWREKVYKS